MTPNFLKSTTAIVLSLSLAVPHMALAQTAAELEAELNVDTSNMTEAELDTLRKQLADQKAQAEAATTATAQAEAEAPVQREVTPEAQAESQVAPESAAPEATAEDKSMLDRAVGAVTGGIEKLTGADETEADAQANTEAAAEAGVKFVERPFSVDEALQAKEAFVTSSTSHVKAVTSIDGKSVGNGHVGELTSRMLDLYVDFIEDKGGPRNTNIWN